jgi:hypothetical protein
MESTVIRGTAAALAVCVLVSGYFAATVSAKPDLKYRKEVTALWGIDYWGYRVRSDADIAPYHREFERIMRHCNIGRELLTNNIIFLADKATDLGAHWVSNLRMMKAITLRITWKHRGDCRKTFHVAEAYMENGGP